MFAASLRTYLCPRTPTARPSRGSCSPTTTSSLSPKPACGCCPASWPDPWRRPAWSLSRRASPPRCPDCALQRTRQTSWVVPPAAWTQINRNDCSLRGCDGVYSNSLTDCMNIKPIINVSMLCRPFSSCCLVTLMPNVPWCNAGREKFNRNYETKIGHEPQILISAFLMTRCSKKRDMVCVCTWSKNQNASSIPLNCLVVQPQHKGREL